jgi:hypothetical protein
MTDKTGKEVCRVCTPNLEGELAKGGSREIAKDLDGSRSYHLIIVGGRGYASFISSWLGPCIVRPFYYSTPFILLLRRLMLFTLHFPLCLLELINPLSDEADLERVDVPNPRWFLRMISQPILIIMMNTIYNQLLTPHEYWGTDQR